MTLRDRINLEGYGDYFSKAGAASVSMGERYGFYDVLAQHDEVTPAELSRQTCTALWFTEAWLNAQATGGYMVRDAETGCYRLCCSLA